MLQRIVETSLRYRGIVLTLAALLFGYGVYATAEAEYDVFPDFVPPQAVVQTEAPGFSPEQVEMLVTGPLESQIGGLEGQESIRSESIQGLSIITIVFEQGVDIFTARQMLTERLVQAVELMPDGVKSPKIAPLTSSTMDLLKIGLVSDEMTPMDLRAFADWTLRPRLLAVPGIAKASVFGGDVRQLQVELDAARLMAFDLSIADVVSAARAATAVRGAGFIENRNQRLVLQTEGQLFTADQLADVMVAYHAGRPVRIGDVADVREGPAPKFGDCLIQGRAGVLMTMSGQYGSNTLEVTRAVEAALEQMQPSLDKHGIKLYPRLHRPATFIETALKNVRGSLLLGALLVAIVLFSFLGSVRTALISLVAIPLSLLSAVVVLGRLGISLNTMTIGGLAIAIGEVVDDAIIDVENIFRRLRERPREESTAVVRQVVLAASLEVRKAVVYATFIVALVFVPVFTMSGLQGSFFAPLALAYVLAILASLAVALTVTPALSMLLFSRGTRREREPFLQARLKAAYRRVLLFVAEWPRAMIAGVALLCVLALARLTTLGGEFLPEFREGHFVVQVSAVPGTSLEEMLRIGRRISEGMLATGYVATVEQQVGRAELGEDPWGPQRSEFHVELSTTGGAAEEQAAEAIRSLLESFPGIQFEVMTFLADRIGESISGETADVVVYVFGDDLDVLDRKAEEMAAVLSSMPTAADVQLKAPTGVPRLDVRLRLDRLTQLGFRPVEVLDTVQTAYQGTIVAQTYRGNQVTDVAVILDEHDRRDPEGVGSLLVHGQAGVVMPLRELADVSWGSGRSSILHEDARRRQTVTCNPHGVDTATFVAEARKQILHKVEFPAGYYPVFAGTAAARAGAQRQLLVHSAVAGVGVILLLFMAFHHLPNVLLVVLNLPFALVGGILAVEVSQWLGVTGAGGVSMGALVGFVTLFGITTRNSIMMLSHFEHLVHVEGLSWDLPTVVRGACDRIGPILMTALVTGLGLLPLAIGSGEAGREIEGPMAIVILGGLVTSTLLNLLVLPTLALRYARMQSDSDREAGR